MNIYESILKNSDIIMLIVNPEGIIIDTNSYTAQLLDDSNLIGKYLYSLVDNASEASIKLVLYYKKNKTIEANFKNEFIKLQSVYINISTIDDFLFLVGFTRSMQSTGLLETEQSVSDCNEQNNIMEYEEKSQWQIRNIDPLTGLYNKEFFNNLFESHYNNVLGLGGNIGIICLNIKDIGNIINEGGQEKANSIMAGFSQVILTSIRSTDYAIKYNNNFLVVVTNTNRDVLKKVSQRISNGASENLSVSLDIGIACTVDSKVLDKWDLIKEAYDNIDALPMITEKPDKF